MGSGVRDGFMKECTLKMGLAPIPRGSPSGVAPKLRAYVLCGWLRAEVLRVWSGNTLMSEVRLFSLFAFFTLTPS